MLGPALAPVERLKTEYRYQILLKAASRTKLNELLARLAALCGRAEVESDGADY